MIKADSDISSDVIESAVKGESSSMSFNISNCSTTSITSITSTSDTLSISVSAPTQLTDNPTTLHLQQTSNKSIPVNPLLDVHSHSDSDIHQPSPIPHNSPGNVSNLLASANDPDFKVSNPMPFSSIQTSTTVTLANKLPLFPPTLPIGNSGDPVGSVTNPIQITSPGIEVNPVLQSSSLQISSNSGNVVSAQPLTSTTLSSSLTSLLALPPNSTFVSSTSSRSAFPVNIPSQLPSDIKCSLPVSAPSSAERAAQEILIEASKQAANKTLPTIGPPNIGLTTATSSFSGIPTPNGSGYSRIPSSSMSGSNQLTVGQMSMSVPVEVQGVSTSLPLSGQVATSVGVIPVPQTMTNVWSGILETVEIRANKKVPRQVQCSMLISKPETTPDIKPNLWPSKITMSIHSKATFNAINTYIRINQSSLRTVQFQFMEPPENVMMLKALMNGDPQNKKVAIVQASPQCPIRAFFMVWNEKQHQFTGLIPLDQEKLIAALKHVMMQSPKPQNQV
jgi:hypothetical protein